MENRFNLFDRLCYWSLGVFFANGVPFSLVVINIQNAIYGQNTSMGTTHSELQKWRRVEDL